MTSNPTTLTRTGEGYTQVERATFWDFVAPPTALFHIDGQRYQFRPVVRPVVTTFQQRRKG